MTTETTAADTALDSYADLSLAADAIFGGTSNEFTLKSLGKQVTVKPATMRQLPAVIGFFNTLLTSMDQESMGALVELIADRQQVAAAAGLNPNKVSVEEMSTQALVSKAFGNVNLFTTLLSSALATLPTLAPIFTNLTEEEYGDLLPDEGMLVAGAIFMVNYSFFTQSLPPLLTAFVRAWSSKNVAPVLAAQTKKVLKRR